MKYLVALAICIPLAFNSTAGADDHAAIRGHVRDGYGNPMLAFVEAVGPGGAVLGFTQTNARTGKYDLRSPSKFITIRVFTFGLACDPDCFISPTEYPYTHSGGGYEFVVGGPRIR